MTNTEIRKKILDFCYKDVLDFTSLYVEKNKGKNWLEVNMSSEFNDLVDKLYQAVIELLLQEIEKARKEVLMEIRDELLEQIEKGRKYNIYGGVADYQDALHLVMGMLSKLKDNK